MVLDKGLQENLGTNYWTHLQGVIGRGTKTGLTNYLMKAG